MTAFHHQPYPTGYSPFVQQTWLIGAISAEHAMLRAMVPESLDGIGRKRLVGMLSGTAAQIEKMRCLCAELAGLEA